MSILDFKGKAAAHGPIVVYQILTGLVLYSEKVEDDGECYVFDSEKTLVVTPVQANRNGQASVQFQKLSEAGIFKSQVTRVPKSAVAFVQDCGNPEVQAKCQEALSGLILPKGTLPPA